MNAHQLGSQRGARRSQRGFSLMELMIVVVITGVLAAIAIPTFSGYVLKSRTAEAVHFLGVIKLKQEAYRSEFGRYAPSTGGATDPSTITFEPDDASGMTGQQVDFPTTNAEFNVLGAAPDGAVRFGYGWAAGLPGDWSAGLAGTYGVAAGSSDHYFIAQAVSDLNDDGTACLYEVTSFTRTVYFTPQKGWE